MGEETIRAVRKSAAAGQIHGRDFRAVLRGPGQKRLFQLGDQGRRRLGQAFDAARERSREHRLTALHDGDFGAAPAQIDERDRLGVRAAAPIVLRLLDEHEPWRARPAKPRVVVVGLLAVLDEVTLDLPMKIVRQSEAEDPDYRRPTSMEVMEKLSEGLGRSGRKGGGGFYDYPADGPKRLWRGLRDHFPPAPEQPDVEQVHDGWIGLEYKPTTEATEDSFGWLPKGKRGGDLSVDDLNL